VTYEKPQVRVVDVLYAAIEQTRTLSKTGNLVDSDAQHHYTLQ
jgi:hypothetical protein